MYQTPNTKFYQIACDCSKVNLLIPERLDRVHCDYQSKLLAIFETIFAYFFAEWTRRVHDSMAHSMCT